MAMKAILFAFAMIDNVFLLLINIFNMITLSDLETDMMNVRPCCEKLNQTFLPEVILHLMLTIFLVFGNQWLLFICSVPVDLWFAYKCFRRSPGQLGFYDPLEINSRRNIKIAMRDFIIRLPVYLIFFFVYLYFFIQALI